MEKVVPISHLMIVFNSSVNFYAYAFKHFLMKKTNMRINRKTSEDIPSRTDLPALCGPEPDLKCELLVINNLEQQ